MHVRCKYRASCYKRICTTHNALLPVGYFVWLAMWIVSDETYLKCEISTSIKIKVTKYPVGSNALWEVLGIFSSMFLASLNERIRIFT